MPSKLLFLDIDGVLNDHIPHSNRYCGIKKECADRFNIVLDNIPDLKIVISSAWRYLLLNAQMTISGFESMLMTHGLDIRDRIHGYTSFDVYDKTPETSEEWSAVGLACRKDQILKYTAEHIVGNWLVIDDLDLKLGYRQIKTDSKVGITYKDIDKIIGYFNDT